MLHGFGQCVFVTPQGMETGLSWEEGELIRLEAELKTGNYVENVESNCENDDCKKGRVFMRISSAALLVTKQCSFFSQRFATTDDHDWDLWLQETIKLFFGIVKELKIFALLETFKMPRHRNTGFSTKTYAEFVVYRVFSFNRQANCTLAWNAFPTREFRKGWSLEVVASISPNPHCFSEIGSSFTGIMYPSHPEMTISFFWGGAHGINLFPTPEGIIRVYHLRSPSIQGNCDSSYSGLY